jgi:hypothetical protein
MSAATYLLRSGRNVHFRLSSPMGTYFANRISYRHDVIEVWSSLTYLI